MRVVEDEEFGCFSITYKDKEEAFVNICYADNFRDDIIITPMDKEDARDFALIIQKMIERRIKHNGFNHMEDLDDIK